MGSVRVRPETGRLFLDFRYQGVRCREQTMLLDTKANRRKAESLLRQIESQIMDGTFDYAKTFPGSRNISKFISNRSAISAVTLPSELTETSKRTLPSFNEFAALWYQESLPQWRPLHQESVRGVLDKYLLKRFANQTIGEISRADILAFRSELSKMPGRAGKTLGNARINKIMTFLRQILNEAAARFELKPAFQGIKPLRVPRADVYPFTLEEVNLIISTCRPDFTNYFTVRFFSGMRTGEIHGLRWRNIDFDNDVILIRETLVNGQISEGAKTYSSCRDIPMLPRIKQALLQHRENTPSNIEWVFWNRNGGPINPQNFTNRVWRPLLAFLNLEYRRPYQTRHTAATLMLAAGESPEWIARVLGHSSTEMLFKTYSRYVPNLTRQDGSAISQLLDSNKLTGEVKANPEEGSQ